MKRRLGWIVMILLLGSMAEAQPSALYSATRSEDSIVGFSTDEPIHDFGVITPWAAVSHTFHLQNAGKAALIIEEVLPSCNCTTANIEKQSVAPGESMALTVTLDPSELEGFVERTVTVRAAGDARTIVRLRASVLEPFHVSTRTIRFENAETTAPPQEIVIEPAIQVTGIETESPITADAPAPGVT